MGKFGVWQRDFDRETRLMKLDSPEFKEVEAKFLKALQERHKAEFVKTKASRVIMKMIEPTTRFRVSNLQILKDKELYELYCAVEILYDQMRKCGFVRQDIRRHNSSSF